METIVTKRHSEISLYVLMLFDLEFIFIFISIQCPKTEMYDLQKQIYIV